MAEFAAASKAGAGGVSHGFVCPPPDEGLWSIAYRMRSVVHEDVTLLGIGVVDLGALVLLVGAVHAAASPRRLRWLRNCAWGLAGLATSPFVGAVAIVGSHTLFKLTRTGWDVDSHQLRHMICCILILVLGVGAAGAPIVTALVANRRMQLAVDDRDLEVPQLRKWAAGGGALVAAQVLWATWEIFSYPVRRALWYFWDTPGDDVALMTGFVAIVALLTAAGLAVAMVVVPVRVATRSVRLRKTRVARVDTWRFAGCVPGPPRKPAKA